MWNAHVVSSLSSALLLAALAPGTGRAFQSQSPEGPAINARITLPHPPSSFEPSGAHLRVDASLAVIPVHVSTAQGSPVTDLSRDSFRLFESDSGGDRVEQKITYFGAEDTPVSVGLLFDTSGSMRNKMHESAEAARAFFKTANTEDEFFLVEFNDRPKLSVGFTPDSEELQRRIAGTRPIGRTSLLDAIHMALVEMKRARHPRKALVILSDGGDNHSRYAAGDIRKAVVESEVEIYAMGIFDSGVSEKPTVPEKPGAADRPALADKNAVRKLPAEERNGPHLLDVLADSTGGKHFPVGRLADLAGIAERIGNQLRSEYVLGYSPTLGARDGKYHRVVVELATPEEIPPLRISYRRGFYGLGD